MMPQEVKKSKFRKTKRKYQKNLPAKVGMALASMHMCRHTMRAI